MATPLPYERQDGETEAAFHAFSIYRDLGRERSLDKVDQRLRAERAAEASGGGGAVLIFSDDIKEREAEAPRKQRVCGQTAQWSSKWKWVERAAEWDRFLDREFRLRSVDEIEKMAKRHAQQAELALSVLMRPVTEFAMAMQDPNRAVQIGTMPMEDLLKFSLAAMRRLPQMQDSERLARGVRVRDNKAGTTQGGTAIWDVETVQPEREEAMPDFEELLSRAAPEWDGDRPDDPDSEDDE